MNKKNRKNGISILMVLVLTVTVLLMGTVTAFAAGEETAGTEQYEEMQEVPQPVLFEQSDELKQPRLADETEEVPEAVLYEESAEKPEAVLYDESDEVTQRELIAEKDDKPNFASFPVWAWILIILGVAAVLLIVISVVKSKGKKN